VNYDMPHVAEDYVHRIGRTGRAGVEGEAVSLVSPEERPLLAAIERLMNRKVESRTVTGFQAGGSRPAPAHKPHHRPAHQPAHQPPQQQPQPRPASRRSRTHEPRLGALLGKRI